MAYTALSSLRAALNTDLGLASDAATVPWGTTSNRNDYLIEGFRRLWPRMARLITETVTPVDGQDEYALDDIRDVVKIEVLDSDGVRTGEITTWQVFVDETDDPVVINLRLPLAFLDTSTTLRVIGYTPYAVPANSDSATSDIPTRLEHVPLTGARMAAYRARLNSYVDYEQAATSNPATRTTPSELLQLHLAAKAEYEQLIFENQRDLSAPRRATQRLR